MGQAIRVGVLLMSIVLCAASATSYSSSYKDTPLGGGAYMVTVEVNEHTSAATARQYAFQRAAEVCGGRGFSVLGADGTSYAGATVVTTQNIGTTSISTATPTGGGHDFTLAYRCNANTRPSGRAVPTIAPQDLPR